MWPIILALGPVKIYSYAVAFLVAVILFFYIIWKSGREVHLDEDDLMDATMIITIIAAIGARLSYIFVVDYHHFGFNLWYWFSLLNKPGLWYFGALVAGGIGAWWQARKRKWDYFVLTDVLVTAYCLFQAVMAFGRFLNGSGYGIISNTFIGMRFGGLLDKHLPVQLFETIAYLVIFEFLLWTEGHYRTFSWYKGSRSEAQSGFITAMYFLLTGMIDLIFSPMRLPILVWGGVRVEVIISFGLMVLGASLMYGRSGTKFNNRKPKLQVVQAKEPSPRWGNDIFN
jgi:phosphatidylglycerol---prolipoprotein diacylglyceryl transferase